MIARMTRIARRAACALPLVLVATLAAAHSGKEETVPADGSTVKASPEVISIVFDGPMRITTVALSDAEGNGWAIDRRQGLEPVLTFEVEPEPLPPGRYIVEWRGLADDGHQMSGQFGFTVE